MRQRLFVGEVVRVPLHGDTEPLGQNIVACGRSFLSSLNLQLIGLVSDCLSQIRIGLQPHGRVGHFLELVQLVVPDRDMGRVSTRP